MSTTLSTTSRQLVLTVVVYQCQSVHSSLAAPSISGIETRAAADCLQGRSTRTTFRLAPASSTSRCGPVGCPFAVRHPLTAAVAAPAPIVERAGDLVSLYLTLSEVTTHVTAVAVENVDRAVPASEHNQLPSKSVDAVRLAVAEVLGQAQAVPASGESGRGRRGFDLANLFGVRLQRHVVVLQPATGLWRPTSRWQGKALAAAVPRPNVISVSSAQPTAIPDEITVDLLVVGSGTGIAAALTAHESGLTALIVEKSRYVGGSTARSGGALWLPASPILEEKGAGDSLERATTYLRSVVADSAPAARSDAFLHNVTATVEMLRRTTPIRLTWAKDYSDYHPELPGGTAGGRTCECRPLNTAILGEHRARLRPGVMEVKIPMPTTTADYRWMNLMARVPRKGLPTIAKRLAQGVGGLATRPTLCRGRAGPGRRAIRRCAERGYPDMD